MKALSTSIPLRRPRMGRMVKTAATMTIAPIRKGRASSIISQTLWRMAEKPARCYTAPDKVGLDWSWKDGLLTAELGGLAIHNVLVVE